MYLVGLSEITCHLCKELIIGYTDIYRKSQSVTYFILYLICNADREWHIGSYKVCYEAVSRASEACCHLVEDEQHIVLVTELTGSFEE